MLKDILPDEVLSIDNAVYIDVRSEVEFNEGTIPGAINFPL